MVDDKEKPSALMAIENVVDLFTDKQLKAIPYLAYGLSLDKVSTIVGVRKSDVDKWMKDMVFKESVKAVRDDEKKWNQRAQRIAGAFSWDAVIDLLESEPEKESKVWQEKMKTARFVLEKIVPDVKSVDVHHSIETDTTLSIDSGSVDIVADRVRQLMGGGGSDNVDDGKWSIVIEEEKEEALTYPAFAGTSYGVIDIDDDGRSRCHVCGDWFSDLGQHISAKHSLTVSRYKNMFGIKSGGAE